MILKESFRRARSCALALALATPALGLVGCTAEEPAPSPKPSPEVTKAELAGVPHYHRWSKRLAQGGQPEGDAGYASLAAEGVSLVLSVDGLPPDRQAAAKHGIRVAHVPIGYDGIAPSEALQILRASQDAPPGTVFIHCHHGKHRGPAAAAIARLLLDKVSNAEAERGLSESCSKRYRGLYAVVRTYTLPPSATIAATEPPPEAVRPEGVRAAMVDLSHLWEGLKAARDAGWKTPPSHPDVDPKHQTTLVWESFRELQRGELPETGREDYLAQAKASEASAKALREALEAGDHALATRQAQDLVSRCDTCHADFRN